MSVITTHDPWVIVMILNWNNASDTLACLESVHKLQYSNYSALVIDNGSKDDSITRIRNIYMDLNIIENKTNLGYADGNNVGIRYALNRGADYILILNNDVRVDPDLLKHLIKTASIHSEAVFFGPKILHLDRPKFIQSAGGELDILWRSRQRGLDNRDEDQFDDFEHVDYLSGAALLVRAAILPKVGLLDPDYFLYREDVDWCLRARQMGYQIRYVPEAKVWHRSHHLRDNDLPYMTYYMTRNSLLLMKKNRGGLMRCLALLLRYLLTALSWTTRPKWSNKRLQRDALIRGIVDYFNGEFGQGFP